MSPNRLLFGFDYNIRIDVVDTISKRRIPTTRDCVQKLYKLCQHLRGRLLKIQEHMALYYNTNHVPKQFKTREFVKLSTKHLWFKC